ncbi:serine/threonine-protein kinase [Planobispora rosea]|uniref:serine/threonine-protein kinase n=1 Tax=Planobispora rosea TaxID=35762 RepID=UPI00083AF458|nr:serine/threonine-protein kinase [Planobispora rosea]
MPYAQPLKPGDPERLGEYEVVGRLGEGGQGAVYLGMHPATGPDPYAVKLLHGSVGEEREAFLREVELAKQVARFCTAQVIDAGLEGDRPYIVSEYVNGPSLHREVAVGGPKTGGALERLAIGTATALTAIHRAGIVHRDLKPQNVLLGPDGPRVIDFGLARALDAAATQTGRGAGTPAYMAPEQVEGVRIRPAADVFAWGATMCFAANAQAPFGQDSIAAVLHRILTAPPELGDLDGWLGALVAECLRKDPRDRPTSRELLLALLGDDARREALDDGVPEEFDGGAQGTLDGGVQEAPGDGARREALSPVPVSVHAAPAPRATASRASGAGGEGGAGSRWGAGTRAPETSGPGARGWPEPGPAGPAERAVPPPDVPGEPAGIRTRPGRAATRASVAVSGSLMVSAVVLVAGVLLPALGREDSAADGRRAAPPAATQAQPWTGDAATRPAPSSGAGEAAQPGEGTRPAESTGTGGTDGRGGNTGGPGTAEPSPTPPAEVTVPSLVGMEHAAALSAIRRAGLTVGSVTRADSREPVGQVLRTWPEGGSRVAEGSEVVLEVSAGVAVPQLTGLRRKAAEGLIAQAGLTPGGVTARCSDRPRGEVLASSPGAGRRVSAGTAVTLTVSRNGTEMPSVTGRGEAGARDALAAAGLAVQVRPKLVTDPSKDGVVLAQHPAPGGCVRRGGVAVITVGVAGQTGPGPGPTDPPDPSGSPPADGSP